MKNYYNKDTVIYLNGEYVKATDAGFDIYSQSLHYGYAVFEGIRSYRTENGDTKIFKEVDHYERLKRSARLVNIPYTYDTTELIEATYSVLAKNNLQDAYIRPLVYTPADMTFSVSSESSVMIAAWPMGMFLGEKLLRIMTSSFQRPNPKGFIIEAKVSGHYINSILASQEAKAKGYDEALLTDMDGFIAEGPGANVFFEKAGKLYTPALGNILPGITRQTVLELCDTLGIEVEQGQYTPGELKEADAAFFCGTAAEIIGWQSLDDKQYSMPWDETVSKRVQDAYKDLIIEKVHTPRAASRRLTAVNL